MSAPTGANPDSAIPLSRSGFPAWTYEEAFVRNRGLITLEEQQRLRNCRVAIAGMGGIGGINLMTLVRFGVGRFSIADPDTFAVANTNRQYGAMLSTMGRPKVEVMAEMARDANPELDLRVFREPVGPGNCEEFLRDADLFIDAVEVFEPDVRQMLFRQAAQQNVFGITGGPVGFSGIWIVFDPQGLSFDRYFDFSDAMDPVDKLVAFVTGVAPKATQRSYIDMSYVDFRSRTAPSCAAACHLAAGAIGCEAIKILLKKGSVRAAPYYQQFDAFKGQLATGYLRGGNRHPLQRLKRFLLKRYLTSIDRGRKPNA
jgi:molybdopterin/thiamine biosynthesis adenylyltransferase